jgi:hypothetical protein
MSDMEQLLNEENVRDGVTDSSPVLGPRPIITETEVTAALKGMKRGKAAGNFNCAIFCEIMKRHMCYS